MPLTIPAVNPLSRGWTHQRLASEAMVLTGTADNEFVHTDHVRAHINIAISTIADLLNLANYPFYGFNGTGTFDTPYAGLETISLGNNAVEAITRIGFSGTQATATPLVWVGNCTKLDLAQLLELGTYKNDGWRNSIAWTHHGNDIVFFIGANIASANRILTAFGTPQYTCNGAVINVMGYRQPVLDNLLPPLSANTSWTVNIDLPDKFMKLALQMTQKMILEQINQQVPAQLDQQINQAIQMISGNIQSELQIEKSEREKFRYGIPQKMPQV